jgi:hypothetical protein
MTDEGMLERIAARRAELKMMATIKDSVERLSA